MYGFWAKLNKPIMAMAPLSGGTDAAFRPIIARYGKPDILFTEFVSCVGLCSPGRAKLLPDLWYSEIERPIVAQIFGPHPDAFLQTAQLIVELGFDGIDINAGCPDKSVEKQGAGAALIKDPQRMLQIMRATREGAGNLPVSVKTRLGYDRVIIEEWLDCLLGEKPAAVTIHARTRNELSKVPARWDAIGRAVEFAKGRGTKTLILGNGDVNTLSEAQRLAAATGVDGVMIGRGIFGNPWLFNPDVDVSEVSAEERLRVMMEHTRRFETTFSSLKNFAVMRRHFKAYVAGLDDAKALRVQLMKTQNADDVETIINRYLIEQEQPALL